MNIIEFAIQNPVKITVGAILVCLFGLLAVLAIPAQLTPEVDLPVVSVTTFWPGASPQEIESEIVDRQEEKLKSAAGLKKMTSVSIEGLATVTLEFNVGVDKDTALRDVSEKLRQVSGYPDEVEEPTLTASDTDQSRTIAWIMLVGGPHLDVSTLKTFADDRIKPILERAEGIANTDVYGGREREIQIRIDPYRLAARGITLRDLEQAIRRQNKNISAGTIAQGKRDYTYRTVGEFTSTEEMAQTVIRYDAGGPVRVRDVATVVDGFAKAYSFVRSRGEYVLAIPARRESDANVLSTMANLKAQIEKVNTEVLPTIDPSLRLEQVYDETDYIESAIDLVIDNVVVGGLLTVAALWIFLRSAAATAIISVSIPISVLGMFLIIWLLGRTMNVVLLAGVAFAVGIVVDNATVVLENSYRHRQMGKSKARAALDGAQEVWGAILASTLALVAVFLPMVFVEEEIGQLFGDIAISIAAAVAISLAVSVLVIPPMVAKMLGRARSLEGEEEEKPWLMARGFAAAVAWANRSTLRRLAVVGGMTGASVVGSLLLMPDADYLPAGNRNLVIGFIVTPPGYTLDEFKRMGSVVEEGSLDDPWDGVRAAWEAEVGSPEAAKLPTVNVPIGAGHRRFITLTPPPIDNFFFVAFNGQCFMGCTSKIEDNVIPLVQRMNDAGGRIPGAFTFFSQMSLFGRGFSSGNSIELEVRGDDDAKVVAAATRVRDQLLGAGLGFPRAEPSNFDLGRPEIRIVPDRAKAADLGLNAQDIGFTVEACINGAFVGEYNDRGDRIDIVLLVEGTPNATPDEMALLPLYTPSGNVVPLASAVRIEATTAPQEIDHIEEMNAVKLTINPPAGMALGTAMNTVREKVLAPLRQSGAIDPGVITSLAGNADKLTQTQRQLIGDFSGTVVGPRWFGLPILGTLGVIAAGAAILVLVVRVTSGSRLAFRVFIGVSAVMVCGFLYVNPQCGMMLFQSRMFLAGLIAYLLMAALFESFLYPFVIMFSVPLAVVGGFAALRIVHELSLVDPTSPIQQLDTLTMLGFVILLGTVVSNAILVVHQALNYMRAGRSPDEAVVKSVLTRTRPIFITALTTLTGTAPLVVMTGPGSELYRGIGSVTVGGLLISTIFTLLVVPALFSLVMQWRAAWMAAPVPSPDQPAASPSQPVVAG